MDYASPSCLHVRRRDVEMAPFAHVLEVPLTPVLYTPRRFADDRGWFFESYSLRTLAGRGIDTVFVQDNHSLSTATGTLRGLHFQRPPHAQAKLVRCVRGRVWDVAVDLRGGSPTFGRHVAAELSADNGRQLFIPVGYGHGFVTLEPDCEIEYKVSDFYAPESDGGVIWNDPALALPWPVAGEPALSAKDKLLPGLGGWESPFDYDGRPLLPLEEPA